MIRFDMIRFKKMIGGLALAGLAMGAIASAATEMAKVNGRPITDKDMMAALGGLNEGQRVSLMKDPSSRRQVLSSLIDQEVLTLEAEKEKLDQDQDFKDQMANFKRQLLVNKILLKNIGSKVTDSGAKKFYDVHKNRYSTDSVSVQHILLSDEQAARDMLKKAKEPGADFQALAEANSKDPSAKNNRGDVGTITRDSPFVEEFKTAAFNAAKGDIIGPVKTQFGYHVIKIVDKKFGKALNYDEVELKVKNDMRQDMIQEYVGQLKKQAKITIDEKAIEKN